MNKCKLLCLFTFLGCIASSRQMFGMDEWMKNIMQQKINKQKLKGGSTFISNNTGKGTSMMAKNMVINKVIPQMSNEIGSVKNLSMEEKSQILSWKLYKPIASTTGSDFSQATYLPFFDQLQLAGNGNSNFIVNFQRLAQNSQAFCESDFPLVVLCNFLKVERLNDKLSIDLMKMVQGHNKEEIFERKKVCNKINADHNVLLTFHIPSDWKTLGLILLGANVTGQITCNELSISTKNDIETDDEMKKSIVEIEGRFQKLNLKLSNSTFNKELGPKEVTVSGQESSVHLTDGSYAAFGGSRSKKVTTEALGELRNNSHLVVDENVNCSSIQKDNTSTISVE